MSFLSGLSSIFHGIGHIFDGGQSDDEKKREQEQAAQQQRGSFTPIAPSVQDAVQSAQPKAAPDQPLEKYDPSKDFYGGAFKGFGNFDENGTLAKVQQPTVQQEQAAPEPQKSGWDKVVDFGKSVAHPFAEFGNAAIHVPQAVYREIQNKPIDDIQKNVFGTTDSGEILKKIVTDTAQVGLAAAAPGISSAAESGVSAAVAPELTSDVLGLVKMGIPLDIAEETATQAAKEGATTLLEKSIPTLAKVGGQAVGGGVINTAFSGINDAEKDGATPWSVLEKAPENFVTGAALDVGGHAVTSVAKDALSKVTDAIAEHSGPSEGEIAPGVKSANENHLADAVHQTTTQEAAQAPVVPAEEAPAPAAPVVTPAVQEAADKATNAPADVNAPPAADGKPTAQNAPRVRKAAAKQLSDISDAVNKSGDEHTIYSNQELTDAGKQVVDTMKDDEVVAKYARPLKFTAPEDVATAKASRDRLANIIRTGTTPEAKQAAQDALNNLVDAASEIQSRSGRVLNYGQEMLDGMPPEAKTAYYIKHIDALQAARYGEDAKSIAADPAERQAVEAQFNKFLTRDEELKAAIAEQRDTLSKALDAETRGDVSVEDLKSAKANVDELDKQRMANNGAMAKYYDSLTPGRSKADMASDWQRSAMLSSPTGRLHALGATVVGAGDQTLKETVAGGLGKLYNAVAAPEKAVRDTGSSLTELAKGGWEGLKKTVNEARGNFEVDNPEKMIKNSVGDNSSEMGAFKGGKFKKVVNAATHLHSNVTEGFKTAEITRDARVEGLREGLSGDDLQKYIISRSDQPSTAMLDRAKQVHLEVNNLNSNPLTDRVTKAANAIAGNSPIGNVIKNQLLPFPRFVAGNIWNQITDKNVVAAFAKTAGALARRDTQGVIDNIAKLGVEGGKTYALGWLLTQHGVLVNQDATGKSYDGTYLHIGNRYIPVSTLGFVAPSLVIGNATYNAFHDATHPGSFVDHLGKSVSESAINLYKSVSGADVLGAGESLTTPINQAVQSHDPSKLVKIGTNIVSQNIPAVVGDVNAGLNQSPLNPTHEAAQTKVTEVNPDTGKDKTNAIKTAEATLLNKVPVASQSLPRQKGVASADLLDKTLHSTRETDSEKADAATKKSQEDLSASDLKNGIPDPNGKYKNGDTFEGAVKARIQDGSYDKAAAGLQQKLDSIKDDTNVAQSTKDEYKNKITQLNVAKESKLSYEDMQLYNSTSLSEWRNFGDPESDTYDKTKYDQLWAIDQALAAKGVAGAFATVGDGTNTKLSGDQKYSAKKPGKGSGRSGAGANSNTLSTAPGLGRINFGNLAPTKVSADAKMPLQQIPAGQLIKQRTITLGKVK